MLDQVIGQLGDAGVERAPGVAGAIRGRGVLGQRHQAFQRLAMLQVFIAHDANRMHHERRRPGLDHREQHRFLLGHVLEQFGLHGFEVLGQADGHLRVIAVHGLHTARHADQLGQLFAVHLVVALQDMVDQGTGLRLGGRFVVALELGQFR